MVPSNTQTEWCRLLIQSLAECGIEHAIVSPGSRSTPLVTALLECDRLKAQLAVDERTAAFFALGQAQLRRTPSVLICTSGSALAHYLPAIIEAKACRLPMLILSADRPKELHGNCSAQTLDQDHFFGRHVVSHLALPSPEPFELSLRALRRQTAQAVARSLGPLPGPVHINVPLRKPLEPQSAQDPAGSQLSDLVRGILEQPVPRSAAASSLVRTSTLEDIALAAKDALRPALAFGPLPPDPATRDSLLELARDCGWPVFSELTSQCRVTTRGVFHADAFDWFLRGQRPAVVPDFLLSFGRPLTSSAWNGALFAAGRDCAHFVVSPAGIWPDPHNAATAIIDASDQDVAQRLLGKLTTAPSSWVEYTSRANENVWRVVESDLACVPDFDEAQATRTLLAALRNSDTLSLGNSLPVRLVDQFFRAPKLAPRVLCQRGLSGIDGLNSVAAGAASVSDGPGHSYLLVGDISFLHDTNGLALVANQERLTIVVLNNHGGRIFEHLPIIGALQREPSTVSAKATEDYWITPHTANLAHASALHGVEHHRCTDASELAQALANPTLGARVIEAELDPSNLRRRIARISSALELPGAVGSERAETS